MKNVRIKEISVYAKTASKRRKRGKNSYYLGPDWKISLIAPLLKNLQIGLGQKKTDLFQISPVTSSNERGGYSEYFGTNFIEIGQKLRTSHQFFRQKGENSRIAKKLPICVIFPVTLLSFIRFLESRYSIMYNSEGLPVHVVVTIQVTRVSLVTVTHLA